MFPPLSDYLHKTGRQLRRDGGQLAPHYDDVRIHALRTRFKKLRAVLRFAAAAGSIPDRWEGLPKTAKALYQSAGAIRDAQVLLLNVSALAGPPLPRMALWLAGRIAGAQGDWQQLYHKKTLRRLEEKLEKIRPAHLRPAQLRSHFKSKLRQMQQLSAQSAATDEQIHDIRKLIKELQYLLAWSKRYWPEGHAAVAHFPLRRIKSLGELAGSYNDLRNAIAALRLYARSEEDNAALAAAGTVLKTWETQRAIMRTKLLRAVGRMG